MALDFDRSILGKVFDETDFAPVTKEDISKFCQALGETNPLFTNEDVAADGPYGGVVAPPTYVTRLRPNKMTPEHMPRLGKVGFDGGRDVEIFSPVRPGDTLKMVSKIHDVYEKTGRSGSMYFIVLRNIITNQDGVEVAIVDHRIMQR